MCPRLLDYLVVVGARYILSLWKQLSVSKCLSLWDVMITGTAVRSLTLTGPLQILMSMKTVCDFKGSITNCLLLGMSSHYHDNYWHLLR